MKHYYIVMKVPTRDVKAAVKSAHDVYKALPRKGDLELYSDPDYVITSRSQFHFGRGRAQVEALEQKGFSLVAVQVSEDAREPLLKGLRERGIPCTALARPKEEEQSGSIADRVVEAAVQANWTDSARAAVR